MTIIDDEFGSSTYFDTDLRMCMTWSTYVCAHIRSISTSSYIILFVYVTKLILDSVDRSKLSFVSVQNENTWLILCCILEFHSLHRSTAYHCLETNMAMSRNILTWCCRHAMSNSKIIFVQLRRVDP